VSAAAPLVFLLDVDNTLVDNDRFQSDLGERLAEWFGTAARDRYWELFERAREAAGYADYLGTLQALRPSLGNHPRLLEMSDFLLQYPFDQRLYPCALEALAHLRSFATPVVLSDGDVIFQPRKIERSGIFAAVEGRMLIYVHKEQSIEDIERRQPARHYCMVDDKPQLLAAMKRILTSRVTTVFVRQGHYAHAAGALAIEPPPDRTIETISDLSAFQPADFKEFV
jgi:hypothetical protein